MFLSVRRKKNTSTSSPMQTRPEATAGQIAAQPSRSDLHCCKVGYKGIDSQQGMQVIKKMYVYGSPQSMTCMS